MQVTRIIGFTALAFGLMAWSPARAEALPILTTTNADCSAEGPPGGYSQDLEFLGGTPTPDDGCGLDTTNFELLYKNNQDGKPQEGAFADDYTTTYFNTPDDPEDALIEWLGGDFISCGTCWLIAKDGSANPGWYGWNLNTLNWDGQEDIDIRDLFIGQGAISHVSIWGIPGTEEPPTEEPPTEEPAEPSAEPASFALFGLAMIGAAYRRRMRP
jgi:hypothetical protein